MSAAAGAPALRHHRPFVLFVAARTVAAAGYAVTAVALPLLVLGLSGSTFLTAAVAAVEVVPYLVFGLVAGALADRVDRRRLMLVCQAVAGSAVLSIPVAAACGVLGVAHVLVAAGVLHTAYVWFDAAAFGVLPALVGRERLSEANSALFASTSLADVVFPVVGGVLIAAVGPALALGADALAYLVAGALVAAVPVTAVPVAPRVGGPVVADPAPGGLLARTRRDVGEGLRFLWGNPVVRALSLVGFAQSLTAGAVGALLVVFAVDGLHLDPSSGAVARAYAAVSTGALLAAVALPVLTRRFPTGRITIAALTANAVLLVALALVTGLVPGLVLLTAWSAASVLAILNGITLRQQLTPPELQSRVGTAARTIAWGGAPVGALLGGALASVVDVRTTYLVASSAVAVGAALAAVSPLRSRDL